ncbi:hypothetical protein BDV26DRAFT_263222 [Aspergillus bertholletiae]|uniref:Uncharacterized protein n=1 Tax=Aspergillus bertholletiae TaxID=1226010 RepID=A0A5N7B6L3_9EURO|nr:hypothetical protein BDV26DRAFT_263222 [Aspergillus bertholletiae]
MKCRIPFLLCLFALIASVIADEPAQRRKLKDCIFKEMDRGNESSIYRFSPEDLTKLKEIVANEVDKEPFKKHNDEEQGKAYKDMEDAAKKYLPHIPTDKVDEFLYQLKDMAMHCTREMGS